MGREGLAGVNVDFDKEESQPCAKIRDEATAIGVWSLMPYRFKSILTTPVGLLLFPIADAGPT